MIMRDEVCCVACLTIMSEEVHELEDEGTSCPNNVQIHFFSTDQRFL